jgi:electron transport complex protein RnfA
MKATSPLCKALGLKDGLDYLNTIVFILVIAALVQFIEMFMKKNMKGLYDALGIYLPLITTNCAVLGVALNNVTFQYNMAECIVYGIGISVGFALALLLMAQIRENIVEGNDKIPHSFQGSPIVLVTASLMAIAFCGFQGLIR